MTEFFRNQYAQLIEGIEACEKNNTDFRKHIECCFHICESIHQLINKETEKMEFSSPQEEITFFKTIKPKFTSLVEFYSIMYRAEIFAPENKIEKEEYWLSEKKRAQQFLSENAEFANYIKKGETFADENYFLRSSKDCLLYDKLIMQILARELYLELLEKKPAT
jgi:hypothetical protein